MDKEINYINNILVTTNVGLTTSEISKLIFENYKAKVSKTIVKNYLWSYFREIIKYDSSNYTYCLVKDNFLINDIDVISLPITPRPINANFQGSKINVEYDNNIRIEIFIKALAIMNFKIDLSNKKIDLIKQLNRIIEQIQTENDKH